MSCCQRIRTTQAVSGTPLSVTCCCPSNPALDLDGPASADDASSSLGLAYPSTGVRWSTGAKGAACASAASAAATALAFLTSGVAFADEGSIHLRVVCCTSRDHEPPGAAHKTACAHGSTAAAAGAGAATVLSLALPRLTEMLRKWPQRLGGWQQAHLALKLDKGMLIAVSQQLLQHEDLALV